jgi:hypothetical protein
MLQKRIFQSDDRLVLHVGYQKAATKFLQGQIFDNLRGHVCYASGARKKEGSDEIRRLLRAVRSLDEINYEKFIASYEPASIPNPAKPIVSNSGLALSWGADRRAVAKRLLHLFNDARILIVTRNQPDLIRSIYSKATESPITRRHFGNINHFLEDPTKFASYIGSEYAHPIHNLDYWSVISAYVDLFGTNNVFVLPVELMTEQKSYASKVLAECLAADQAEVAPLLNRPRVNVSADKRFKYLPVQGRRLAAIITKKKLQLSDHWRERIKEVSSDSNKQLQKLVPFSLSELGYPMTALFTGYVATGTDLIELIMTFQMV